MRGVQSQGDTGSKAGKGGGGGGRGGGGLWGGGGLRERGLFLY